MDINPSELLYFARTSKATEWAGPWRRGRDRFNEAGNTSEWVVLTGKSEGEIHDGIRSRQ